MYQHILVPIDGSVTASKGLDEAIKLAQLSGGSLRIFHAVDDLSVAGVYEGAVVYAGDLISVLKEAGVAILEAAKARATASGVKSDGVLLETFAGRVSDRVVEQAKAWPADLIVLGTHGRRGLGRVLLGSDAEQIVRTSPVPVLLVRAPEGGVSEVAAAAEACTVPGESVPA